MATSAVHPSVNNDESKHSDDIDPMTVQPFQPAKRLRENDYTILDMLHSAGHDNVSFCITDPHIPDNPVIYVSEGFIRLTGYKFDDVVGRNCRFLQGPETDEKDRQRIFDAVKTEKECSVNLLNYKKDGTKFVNEVSTLFAVFMSTWQARRKRKDDWFYFCRTFSMMYDVPHLTQQVHH